MNKELPELLRRFREDTLTPEDLARLNELLTRPEGREVLRNDWFLDAALPQSLAAAAVAVRVPQPSLAARLRAWLAWPPAEEPGLATLQLWSRASFAALAFGLVAAAWLVMPPRGTMESDSDPAFIAQLMLQNQLSDEP
jgi:hypothetical protein